MADIKVKLKDEQLLALVKTDKDMAVDYYNQELKDNFNKWENLFNGNPDCYNKSYRMPSSFYVSRDIMTTIRAVLPDLMKLIFTNEPVSITGRTSEDTDKAKKMQTLCNWQITRLNPFFLVCNTVFLEALLKGMSVVKLSWEKIVEDEEFEEEMSVQDMQTLQQQGAEIISSEFLGEVVGESYYYVKYKAGRIKKNQPVISVLPSGEFLFDPSAKDVSEANYIIHRKIVTKDFLKRKEIDGIYKNVDLVKGLSISSTDDEDELFTVEEQYRQDNSTENEPRHNVVLYEYWGKLDVNDDGLLEDVVVTFAGDVLLSVQENTFGEYPFFVFAPFPSAFQIPGMGIGELVENVQSTKTALFREFLENVRRNNDRKIFYNFEALIAPSQMNDPNEKYVAINKDVPLTNVVMSEPFEQMSPNIRDVMEYLNQEKQVNTGISELKQGVNKQDRQTATEASIKYEATNNQVQMIAVIFANKLKEMYEFLVYQNQKFIDEPQVIRLLNSTIEITPDDLSGEFDLDVSISLGTGTAETRKRTLYSILEMLINVAEPKGITNSEKIRNVMSKILEENGFKDTETYILSTEEMQQQQAQMQQIQQMQAQIQQMQQGQQNGNFKMPNMASQMPQQETMGGEVLGA